MIIMTSCITSGDALYYMVFEVSVNVVVAFVKLLLLLCTCIYTQITVSVLSPHTAQVMYSNQLLTE